MASPPAEDLPTGAPESGDIAAGADPVPFGAYWQLRMQSAAARLEAVKQIVAHNPTRGTFAEALLRELIAEFLPQRYAAPTGFIMHGTGRSSQIDVLIYDQLTNSPVFRDGGFVVSTPGTAKVAIEVKGDLKGGTRDADNEIKRALDHIRSVKQTDADVKGFVFGFTGNGAETFAGHFEDWRVGTDAPPRDRWPDGIYNLGRKFSAAPDLLFDVHDEYVEDSPLVLRRDDNVIKSFFTAVLQSLALSDLRIFFGKNETGVEIKRF